MQFNLRILSVLFLLLAITYGAFACSINVDNLITQVRSDGSYDTTITAEKNTLIDAKLSFDVSYSGTNCPTNLTTKLKIFKYDEDNSDWVLMETPSKSESLAEGDHTVYFSDEFNTGSNSNYVQFRVEGYVLDGTNELAMENAFVDVEDNSCEGIDLITSSFTIDEGVNSTKTFTIENNTGVDFRITSADLSSSSSAIRSGYVTYPAYVYSHSDDDLDLSIESGSVSSNTTTTVSLNVTGYLGNTYCSAAAIGRKNISVTISNNSSGNSNDSSYSTSSDCDDIDIQTRVSVFDESSTQKLVFGVKNNSTKRFEVLSVEPYSSNFTLSNYFNEKYIFSGQTGELILNAVLPNVTQNRTLQGTVKVRGIFSDGRSCSFTQIGTKTFDVNVLDVSTNNNTNLNCSGFNISAPNLMTVENYGALAFTITNNTNKSAKIIVEGSIDVTPTIIVLPRNSSLSKIINIQLNSQSGFVKFTPTIEGCGVSAKTVQITNTATGTLSDATMSVSLDRDYNLSVITLSIQVNNSTNKIFNGLLIIDSPNGWPSIEKNVTITPGENTFTEKLGSSGDFEEGVMKVSFSSEGKTLSKNINTNEQNNMALAGLFAFGGNVGIIGIILLIILVVIILVGMLDYSPNTKATKQEWVNEKN